MITLRLLLPMLIFDLIYIWHCYCLADRHLDDSVYVEFENSRLKLNGQAEIQSQENSVPTRIGARKRNADVRCAEGV